MRSIVHAHDSVYSGFAPCSGPFKGRVTGLCKLESWDTELVLEAGSKDLPEGVMADLWAVMRQRGPLTQFLPRWQQPHAAQPSTQPVDWAQK